MPTILKSSIASLGLAVVLAACAGKGTTDAASQDDFKRDLQLASSTVDLAAPRVDPSLLTLENKPQGAPQTASVLKKGAGTRAVRSKAPTVRATPETELAASDEQAQQVNVVQEAPTPEVSEPVAVAPRPSPTPVVLAGDGGGDYGTSGNGGGIFGPGGGMGGSVIRGGGVDGDHCEIHGGGRRNTGGIYIPQRTGGTVISGGSIGLPRRGGMGTMGGMGGVSRGGMGGMGGSRISVASRPTTIGTRRGR